MLRWLALSILTLPLLAVVSAGCDTTPREGKSCDHDKDSVKCVDPQTRASCEGEKWHVDTCLGPKGCDDKSMLVSCDVSLAKEATPCGKENNLACTLDKTTMLRCTGGKWALSKACSGPKACAIDGFLASCDTANATEGGLCESDPEDKKAVSYSCTADKKTMLGCSDRKWKKVESCIGPSGCEIISRVSCNGAAVKAGDFCIPGAEDDYACATDGKSSLKCDIGGWKVKRACLGPKGCSALGSSVECDDTIQEPGAACEREEEPACSTDGKTVLHCTSGKFTKSRACPKACKVDGTTISCE
jgi:hypothetical protein